MKKNLVAVTVLFSIILLSACQREPDPQEAVKEGMQKLADHQQSSFELAVKATGKENDQPYTLRISLKGKGDSREKGNEKLEMAMANVFDAGANKGDVSFDARYLEDHVYLRLSKLAVGGNAIPAEVVSQFVGKWWDVPAADEGGEESYTKGLLEDKEKLFKTLKENEIFGNILKVGEEEVRGELSRKYQVELSKPGVQKLVEEVSAVSSERALTEEEKNAIQEFLQKTEFTGYVWVGKESETVRRIVGTLRATLDEGGILVLDVDTVVFDFDKEVVVEKPSDATPFNPALLFGLAGSLLTPPPAPVLPPGPIDQPLGAEQVKN